MTTPLTGRTVLVTGATGFIGRRVVERCAEDGAEVHATSRGEAGPAPATWHRLDPTDRAAVARLLDDTGAEIVLHLSGAAHGRQEPVHLFETFEANTVATLALIEALVGRGTGRLVTAGSMEEPDPERGETRASSPYGASKWAATIYARLAHDLYDLDWVDLRTFMTYGPRQPNTAKLIPATILRSLRGEPMELASGERRIDWIHVDDVAEAFVAAATAPDVAGRRFDVGSGEAVSVRDLVQRIVALVPGAPEPVFGAVADRAMEVVRVADIGPTTDALRWRPRRSLDDGLAETIDWFRTGGTTS